MEAHHHLSWGGMKRHAGRRRRALALEPLTHTAGRCACLLRQARGRPSRVSPACLRRSLPLREGRLPLRLGLAVARPLGPPVLLRADEDERTRGKTREGGAITGELAADGGTHERPETGRWLQADGMRRWRRAT